MNDIYDTLEALKNFMWIASGTYFLVWFFKPCYRVWRRARQEAKEDHDSIS